MTTAIKSEFTPHELRAQALRDASIAPSKAARRMQRHAHIIARSNVLRRIQSAQVDRANARDVSTSGHAARRLLAAEIAHRTEERKLYYRPGRAA